MANASYVFGSGDSGQTWQPILDPTGAGGRLTSFAAHFGASTTSLYAGVSGVGILQSTDPPGLGSWANLNTTASGLPPAIDYQFVLVDICDAKPERIYALFFPGLQGAAGDLYTTAVPRSSWTMVTATPPRPVLDPGNDPGYDLCFTVAPNSPGDGTGDVLLFGSFGVYRSVDAGRTWEGEPAATMGLHEDVHTFAFYKTSGAIPTTLVGCDGGIARSSTIADPAVKSLAAATGYFNQGDAVTDSPTWQNLNHGLMSTAALVYACDPRAPTLSYLGCQDTGIAAGQGSLGWRGLQNADVEHLAVCAGPSGLALWWQVRGDNYLVVGLDSGLPVAGGRLGFAVVRFDAPSGRTTLLATSNLAVSSDDMCVAGVRLSSSGLPVVVRVSASGHVDQIGGDFSAFGEISVVACDPTDLSRTYCAVGGKVFRTTAPPWAGATWEEIAGGTALPPAVSAITVDPLGRAYVLLREPDANSILMYEVSGGIWIAQTCLDAPKSGSFTKLVADPTRGGLLYAAVGNNVYRIELLGVPGWRWNSITNDLPKGAADGSGVLDLWIGNIGSAASPKIMLRATVATRGVWELDVTPGSRPAEASLYFRDHILDSGYVSPTPDGIPNPFRPGEWLFHYMSPDIKVELPTVPKGGGVGYYATDLETPPGSRLDHVLFDQLVDAGTLDLSRREFRLHVQLHNHSLSSADAVSVWAIFCEPSVGMPSLGASALSGNAFKFWEQFRPDGSIVPDLPSDSPWYSVGPPVVVSGVSAERPRVASWERIVPPAITDDHVCVAAFAHSASHPIGEGARMSLDAVTPTNAQVAQRNLHALLP